MTPQRMCVACRQMKDKRELVRCRVTPEKTVELDPTGKKKRTRRIYMFVAGVQEKGAQMRSFIQGSRSFRRRGNVRRDRCVLGE